MHQIIRKAFTLIELLVVIAIIGILSGLIIVTMNGVTQSANIAKAQIFSNSLRNALMMNLISEWKFDETSGTSTADSWSGGNTGTLNNFDFNTADGWRTGSQCVSGGCLQFDGNNDNVTFGTNSILDITGRITMEAWFKTTNLTGINQIIIQKSANETHADPYRLYAILINSTSYPRFSLSTGVTNTQIVLTGNTIIQTNKWYHLVGTWNGTTANIYLNGVKDNPTGLAFSGPIGINSTYLRGGNNPTLNEQFAGYIDNVRLYNEMVPASQIKEQYYSGLNNLFINKSISLEEYRERLSRYSASN